jgi:NADPH:quinone reductase-like Zn-dependent oxidoreductase
VDKPLLLTFYRDYGFGIPTLPYIAGRDLVGVVIKGGKETSRVQPGDVVGDIWALREIL